MTTTTIAIVQIDHAKECFEHRDLFLSAPHKILMQLSTRLLIIYSLPEKLTFQRRTLL